MPGAAEWGPGFIVGRSRVRDDGPKMRSFRTVGWETKRLEGEVPVLPGVVDQTAFSNLFKLLWGIAECCGDFGEIVCAKVRPDVDVS